MIVQGRYDMCTPPAAAWDLHRAWPEARLEIVPDGGHLFNEPGVLDGLIRAADGFAALICLPIAKRGEGDHAKHGGGVAAQGRRLARDARSSARSPLHHLRWSPSPSAHGEADYSPGRYTRSVCPLSCSG